MEDLSTNQLQKVSIFEPWQHGKKTSNQHNCCTVFHPKVVVHQKYSKQEYYIQYRTDWNMRHFSSNMHALSARERKCKTCAFYNHKTLIPHFGAFRIRIVMHYINIFCFFIFWIKYVTEPLIGGEAAHPVNLHYSLTAVRRAKIPAMHTKIPERFGHPREKKTFKSVQWLCL